MVGKFESNKDRIQELTSSGAKRVGNIASIITGTVAEVSREIGEWVTDVIEMNEAAAAARKDEAAQRDLAEQRAAAKQVADERPGADAPRKDDRADSSKPEVVDGEVVIPQTTDIIDAETVEDTPARGSDETR